MCGRYVIYTHEDIREMYDIAREISEKFGRDKMPEEEIFPTNTAPVLVEDTGVVQATLMKWGLPKYSGKGVIINARAETAAEKYTFKSALISRRCVIPCTGFYEWSGEKNMREKYQFNLPDTSTLYMAGIYNTIQDESCFCILTTAANASMQEIHNRMPVILQKNELDNWLHEDNYTEYLSRIQPELIKRRAG